MRVPRLRPSRSATDEDPRPVWAVCAAVLDYPTPTLIGLLDELASLVPGHDDLGGLIGHLRDHELGRLQADYVTTFDHTRKCALHLTYFAYGDTRRRGRALLAFKDAYRDAGAAWDDTTGELPDHLCAVLQFGATVDAAVAGRMLADHRAGLEMLRLALTGWRNDDGSTGSPWAAALRSVCATLPALRGEEQDAVRRLVEQGPPAEEVGLDGYGADPALIAPATIPVRG